MMTAEIRIVKMTKWLAGYAASNVSYRSACTPSEIDELPILEYDESGELIDIVDGFHRVAGYAAAGVSEFRAVCCTTDGDDDLVAAAADGSGSRSQSDAIAEIYRRAGLGAVSG